MLVPASNVKHLMLREEVIAASVAGQFSVWPVSTLDEALVLLTGEDAGEALGDGLFPPASVNGRVQARLRKFSALRQTFANARARSAPPPSRG